MNKKKKGFALIELTVTLAVAALLITSGLPAFARFVRNNRETTAVDNLVGALSLARSEKSEIRRLTGSSSLKF